MTRTKQQAQAEIKRFTQKKRRTLKALATGDALDADTFLERNPPAHPLIRVIYRCPNRHKIELSLPNGPVICERCGLPMRPQL